MVLVVYILSVGKEMEAQEGRVLQDDQLPCLF